MVFRLRTVEHRQEGGRGSLKYTLKSSSSANYIAIQLHIISTHTFQIHRFLQLRGGGKLAKISKGKGH